MIKKNRLQICAFLLLFSGIVTLDAPRAQAQGMTIPVTDAGTGTTSATNNMGQQLGVLANAQTADTTNANNRLNTLAQALADEAAKNAVPADYCPCYNAGAAAARVIDHTATSAFAQAMAQSQGARINSGATGQLFLKQDCTLFAPTNATDPTFAVWQKLCQGIGVTPTGTHGPRGNRTMQGLLGPLQYPLVQGALTTASGSFLQNGSFTINPVTAVSTPQQLLFMGALSYCQHVTPPLPVPPTVSTIRTSVPIEWAALAPYVDAEALGSAASSTCYQFLAERIQIPSGVTLGTTPELGALQRKRCQMDFASNVIDQARMDDCTTNGRSDLAADRDEAYYLTSSTFHSKVLATLPWPAQQQIVAQAKLQEEAFDQRLSGERATLIAAIKASDDITAPRIGNQSVTVP